MKLLKLENCYKDKRQAQNDKTHSENKKVSKIQPVYYLNIVGE